MGPSRRRPRRFRSILRTPSAFIKLKEPRILPRFYEYGVHHFGYAMSLCFWSEPPDEKDDDEAADHRRKKNKVAERTGALTDVCVVNDAQPAIVRQIVHEADQRAKADGAKSGHDANHQGERAKYEKADLPLFSKRLDAAADQGFLMPQVRTEGI